MTKSTWKYISPRSLAANDIYSDNDDLETLRDHIMFPAERPSVLNTITQRMGQPGFVNGSSFSNLLDEASIEKIAMSAWKKFWNRFLIFGNALEYRNIYKRKNHKTNIIYNRPWICSAYHIWMINVFNRKGETNKQEHNSFSSRRTGI